MLCVKPWGVHACGRCRPCRMNRRRMWVARLTLESFCHPFSSMFTLTYADAPLELVPGDLRDFLKRLRFALAPRRIRFYAVGEYGSVRGRPHYHVCLFGVSRFEHDLVAKAWGHGLIHAMDLTPASAGYVVGYISKGMTDADHPELLGKHPEFARMSLRPRGLGFDAVETIAAALLSHGGCSGVARGGDVPTEIRLGGKKLPLGRYLRNCVREAIGWDTGAPIPVRLKLAFDESMMTTEEVELRARKREVTRLRAERMEREGRSRRKL